MVAYMCAVTKLPIVRFPFPALDFYQASLLELLVLEYFLHHY